MKIHLVLAVGVSVFLCQDAKGVMIKTGQMIGLQTGDLGSSPLTGQLESWDNSTSNVRVTNGVGSLILTNLNGQPYLVESAGDRAFTTTNIGLNCRNQFVPASTLTNDPSTNIYFSWLYRFRDASLVPTTPTTINRLNTGSSGTGNFQHFDLLARNIGGGNIQIGITKAPVGTVAVTNWATTNIAGGQTFLVVVRAQLLNALATNIYGFSGNSNNIYELWINPPSEFLGTNEANVPTNYVSAMVGQPDSPGIENVGSGPGRLVFGHGAYSEFDEFRCASTWAEVTPWFGQCVPAGIAISPFSKTNCAEISTALEVFASGTTAPLYQWQVSTNAGTTWSNVAGATGFRYTTPNLAIGQSGIQYRAIVGAACDGSSATSSVATVTLTNPVVTPDGVLMNDTFLDDSELVGFDSRSNLPLGPTNSVWFTQTPEFLEAYLQGGNLVGINSNNASLWLGYFETNVVHLAVGKRIQITLPFRPDSFTAFTNNGNVRWGLFDYFDAGTRITGDGPLVGGSAGLGAGVRGYMLSLDFGTNFVDNTPMGLFARSFLPSANLMGSQSDYTEIGEGGPIGGEYSNTVAFAATTNYTLALTADRIDVNRVLLTATVTGGGLNLSHSVLDTNFAYHRFDSFGIRPANAQTTADQFTFSDFKVEVLDSAAAPTAPSLNIQKSGTNVVLSWANSQFRLQETTNLVVPNWQSLGGAGLSFTNPIVSTQNTFFRLIWP